MAVPDTGERTGVVVVRVWVEPPPSGRLRARVTAEQVGRDDRATTVAASVEDVVRIVRGWLERFEAERG